MIRNGTEPRVISPEETDAFYVGALAHRPAGLITEFREPFAHYFSIHVFRRDVSYKLYLLLVGKCVPIFPCVFFLYKMSAYRLNKLINFLVFLSVYMYLFYEFIKF